MAETPKTPSGHETLYTGQQFLDALTPNEIASLLAVLIGTLSPDMVDNVLDQLQPDTRQTVQTILVPPDSADPTHEKQARSVSLAKLEQTWSRRVKIIMRPRARSISGARPVVHGTESGLHSRLPGWIAEKAGRYPCPDDCAPDDNGPHTR